MENNLSRLGYFGEMHVLYKLAKLDVFATLMPHRHDYDIITENDIRIEVKTSIVRNAVKKVKRKKGMMKYPRNIWQFNNAKKKLTNAGNKSLNYEYSKRDRDCDIFVLICLDKDRKIVREYIVPKRVIGQRKLIIAGEKDLGYLAEYKNRWDLITSNFVESA